MLGRCGSASINPDSINPDREPESGATGLFEPAHGSSPHRTGTRRSNPTGAWLALAALLDWCTDIRPLGLGTHVRSALADVHAAGIRTYDLATGDTTAVDMDEFNRHILTSLETHRG